MNTPLLRMSTEQAAPQMRDMLVHVYMTLKKRRKEIFRKEDKELSRLECEISHLLCEIDFSTPEESKDAHHD